MFSTKETGKGKINLICRSGKPVEANAKLRKQPVFPCLLLIYHALAQKKLIFCPDGNIWVLSLSNAFI